MNILVSQGSKPSEAEKAENKIPAGSFKAFGGLEKGLSRRSLISPSDIKPKTPSEASSRKRCSGRRLKREAEVSTGGTGVGRLWVSRRYASHLWNGCDDVLLRRPLMKSSAQLKDFVTCLACCLAQASPNARVVASTAFLSIRAAPQYVRSAYNTAKCLGLLAVSMAAPVSFYVALVQNTLYSYRGWLASEKPSGDRKGTARFPKKLGTT